MASKVCTYGCMHAHMCVSEAGRLLGETYKEEGQVKFTSPSSCSVHSPHAVHSHKHAHTHIHVHAHCYTAHTLPALTIHLSTLFYSFYQEYCCYTFQAFPGFLVCRAQRGKTSQPYFFTSKNSFIIIIIFQSLFIIIADVFFFLFFLTILKRRTWHLLQVFSKTCSLTEDYDVGCWLIIEN